MSPVGSVALILVEIGLMLVSNTMMRRRPNRHAPIGLLYGAALAVSVIIFADSATVAVADRSVVSAVGAAAWLGVVYLQVRLYRMRARASFRNSVWDAETRRWVPGRPVMMLLAPIDVPTTDGRPGLIAGEWSVPVGGAAVRIDDPDAPGGRRVVGRIDEVWLGNVAPTLYGAGVIAEGVDMAGRLPEVEIRPTCTKAKADPEAPPAMFPAGQVTGVLMRHSPTYKGSWVRYGEGRTP